ncbi:MAG TPA: transferrin receptor-like dimerization domain-containing protein, partial [Vicinamibacteria bacterium]|nr:transferrin receptor-like dimerization domain-containing protein [Vicinamibacteria bacterium]
MPRAIHLVVLSTLLSTVPSHAEEDSLKGFLPDEVAAAREWETKLREIPNPANLREYMRVITEEPHIAGLPGSKKVADYILSQFKSWGLNAWIEETEALMPLPTERHVELLEPTSYVARLEEPSLLEDKDSADPGQLPTYNAYAAEGDVTAQLVYVNYGIPEDYEKLGEMGIDVEGRIVIARYGKSWRGIKAKLAQTHGAVGCLIYSDPRDDGYFEGLTYPEGPFRPDHGVQRGSIMDMPIHPGDPLSPGFGAKSGEPRLDISEAKTLVKIPVLPISYGDALPLLRSLRGPIAPDEWRGALPITYHIGPGPALVNLKLSLDWKTRPLYNVIARIDGSMFPDEWIVHGNHHDGWNNGAMDPTSGNVALMETARAFSELLKQGWKPKRTIIFASWDGEEWGLLGSTEWAETHKEELLRKGVAYINSDSTGKGWLNMSGSHTLQELINDVARDVPDPERGVSVWQAARDRALEQAKDDAARNEIEQSDDLRIDALGSGSDYTVFLDHLTMASLNLGFGGDSPGGVYHSNYDSFDWYRRFSDGDFVFGRALSQTIGTAILRLADATILPFNFIDLADTMARYVEEIREAHAEMEQAAEVDLTPVDAALDKLRAAGEAYEAALRNLESAGASALLAQPELQRLNHLLYTSERRLAHDEGLPHREWFRHQVYAPGFYTGYGVKTIPGIREGIEEEAWEQARHYVRVVSEALESLVSQIDEA